MKRVSELRDVEKVILSTTMKVHDYWLHHRLDMYAFLLSLISILLFKISVPLLQNKCENLTYFFFAYVRFITGSRVVRVLVTGHGLLVCV